jgi:hemolysin activation/secretion protein
MAQADAPPPAKSDDSPQSAAPRIAIDVERVEIRYKLSPLVHRPGDLPTEADLAAVRVDLALADGVLTSRHNGGQPESIALSELGRDRFTRIDADGIREIARALVRRLTDAGYIGVAAAPDPSEFSYPNFEDLRKDSKALTFLVYMGFVEQVRTVVAGDADDAAGQRIDVDKPSYNRVKDNSPLQKGDLLDERKLKDYVGSLSRNPTRRVEVAIAAASEEPGAATVDYLIAEAKPWLAYFQVSNTGTKQTNEWRERFGFQHTQLTGRDDILHLDYTTAGFDASHAFAGSYEIPVDDAEKLRLQVFGGYNEYTASDVGFALLTFTGNSFNIGGQAAYQVWQHDRLWVDAVAGFRYEENATQSSSGSSSLSEGEGRYAIPYIGARAGRFDDSSSFDASVMLEFGIGLDGAEKTDALGRLGADRDYQVLKFDVGGAFYIEPLLNPEAWNTRTGGPGCTLAHEIYLHGRGQWALGNRLVPTAEQVLGGFPTVRGYPESLIAGDSLFVATLEYRFHLPHAFAQSSPGTFLNRSFRGSPSEPWGATDWDLILRGFVDAGWSKSTGRTFGEVDGSLVSAGVGAEFQFRSNLNARLDWGFPLRSFHNSTEDVEVGDNRLHFVLTLSF